jgi:hypothetical protein
LFRYKKPAVWQTFQAPEFFQSVPPQEVVDYEVGESFETVGPTGSDPPLTLQRVRRCGLPDLTFSFEQ